MSSNVICFSSMQCCQRTHKSTYARYNAQKFWYVIVESISQVLEKLWIVSIYYFTVKLIHLPQFPLWFFSHHIFGHIMFLNYTCIGKKKPAQKLLTSMKSCLLVVGLRYCTAVIAVPLTVLERVYSFLSVFPQ